MSKDRKLHPIELIARPPLNDIPNRLRLLADELPEDTTGIVVVCHPNFETFAFGDLDMRAKTIGVLFAAATKGVTND